MKKKKSRPSPYQKSAPASATFTPRPVDHTFPVKLRSTTTNNNPFGGLGVGNLLHTTSDTTVVNSAIGEDSALFSVQDQTLHSRQSNIINDKHINFANFVEESQLYVQFEMFLDHVRYLDKIDISSITEGFENIAFWV